jgi:hypothetical protein
MPKIRQKISLAFWALALILLGSLALSNLSPPSYLAQAPHGSPIAFVTDHPSITITTATADTTATGTPAAHEALVNWTFGTVTGSYGTCTVQAKTSVDGTHYLTLGTAVSVTATTGTVNQWSLIEQIGTTSVTSSAVSATVALGFGQLTKFTFACTSYGTSAPVSVTVIYK